MGSRNYIAPEMESGRLGPPTDRTDVYSLGKWLTGCCRGLVANLRVRITVPKTSTCRTYLAISAGIVRLRLRRGEGPEESETVAHAAIYCLPHGRRRSQRAYSGRKCPLA